MRQENIFGRIPDIKLSFRGGAAASGSAGLYFAAAGKLFVPENETVALPGADLSCAAATLGGNGCARNGSGKFVLGRSSFMILDCRNGIELSGAEGGSRFFLLFISGGQVSWFSEYLRSRSSDGFSLRLPGEALFRLSEVYDKFSYYDSDLMRQLNLLSFVLTAAADFSALPAEDTVPKYLASIKQNFDNEYRRSYSLDMLEHDFHVNKYKIAKDFTAYYGTAPIKYLNNRRMEAARKLLLETNHKVNEISFMVGIENVTHFIRLFKRYTGMTPAVYRKTYGRL